MSTDLLNSRAYQFQLEAAAAAAAALVPPVHAADDKEPEPPTPKVLPLQLEGQGTSDASPAPQQGSGVVVAPMAMGAGIAEPTKCPECPKWFASEKAMFGHLRKHPERGYKGATRPATAAAALAREKMPKKKQLAWNKADVSAMNPTAAAATAGEKKSAKRGRAPQFAAGATGKQQAGSDGEDEEAAMILLGMASSSNSTPSETVSVQQAVLVHAPDAASGHEMPAVEPQQPMLLDDHVAEQIVQPAGTVLEISAESQTPPPAVKDLTNVELTTEALQVVVVPATSKPAAAAPSPGSGSTAAAKQKAKKQRRAVAHLEQAASAAAPAPPPVGADGTPAVWRIPPPASSKRHVCPTCGKWFSTYQALGGHMSSHAKAKDAGVAPDELAAAQARHNIDILAHRNLSGGGLVLAGAGTGSGAGWGPGLHLQRVHPPPALMAAPPHVCAVCHTTFPSGQALGGHKRKHWFPEKHQVKAAEPTAPAPALTAWDFDVNELPEEGEGENDQP